MPIFELEIDLNPPGIPDGGFIQSLIFQAGNDSFETYRGEYGKTTLVKCQNKPRDSVLFGVRWLEPAGQKNAAEDPGNSQQHP